MKKAPVYRHDPELVDTTKLRYHLLSAHHVTLLAVGHHADLVALHAELHDHAHDFEPKDES